MGNVPALVDTRPQFSCVRSDVIEFLYMREERRTFSSCSMSCFLADGQRCGATCALKDKVKVKVLP